MTAVISTYSLRALLPVLVVAIFSLAWVDGSNGMELTPQEERGRQIYFSGTSPNGAPLVGFFGKEYLEVPGQSATCASCHGYDGLGRTESGVIPSNITWTYLMKSYGHIHPDGLEHQPFSIASLKSYMRDGVYPGGRLGDPSMPVYEIAEQDLDDLLAYLKRLDTYLDPGLSDTTIRIGTVAPAGGGAADLGNVLQRTVQAYFADINSRGGIYGRSLELVTEKAAVGPGRVRELVTRLQAFALLGTLTPGGEKELARVAEELQIPLIAPILPVSPESEEVARFRFYLYATLRQQVRVLAQFGTRRDELRDPKITILYPAREEMEKVAGAAEAVYAAKGWRRLARMSYPAGGFDAAVTVQLLQKEGCSLLLFLGGEAEAGALLREAGEKNWAPLLFMPGLQLGKALYQVPPLFKDKLWLAYPSLPDDRKGWGLAEFEGMAARQKLPVTHPTAQLEAYAGAKLLVEGLRRAGRDVSREKLVESLERLHEFDTGLTPLLSYGKNRRHGSIGAHVVAVDPLRDRDSGTLVPQGWFTLND